MLLLKSAAGSERVNFIDFSQEASIEYFIYIFEESF